MSLVTEQFIPWILEEIANVLRSEYGSFLIKIFLLMTGIKFIVHQLDMFDVSKLIKVGMYGRHNSDILDHFTELQDIVIVSCIKKLNHE